MSVLVVVLDGADSQLLWRWAERGELPVLAQMLATGASAQLSSPADVMPESAWPVITTGADVGSHGLYNWRPIRPGSYQRTNQPPATCRRPIWDVLRTVQPEARAVVLDAPYSLPLGDERVTEALGWGIRGALGTGSSPPELLDEVVERHGRFPQWTDEDYRRRPREERRLVAALEGATERRTAIALELLARHEWDLGLICYCELHNAGHALYRHFTGDARGPGRRRAALGQAALLRLYKATDAALGRLRAAVGDETDMLVCTHKGFRPNTSGLHVLPAVLEGLGYQVGRKAAQSRRMESAIGLVRALAPRPLRRWIFGRMSPEQRNRVLERMWIETVDWGRSRALAEPELNSGAVRLNVRGRDPAGIVDPGDEYERLLAEISEELLKLTHAASGAPAIERVLRRDEWASGPNVHLLPDLLIVWTPHVMLDAVHHPRLGIMREHTRDLPSSEHTGAASVIATGPSFRSGVSVEGPPLADVAATALHLAGAPLPHDMDGRPLADLLQPTVPEERRVEVDWALDPWAADQAEARSLATSTPCPPS